MTEKPTFTITFVETKGDGFLGKIAGSLLGMIAIREVRKDEKNQKLICIITSHDAVEYDSVSALASAATHTISRDSGD